jgi:energy-coupling factor transport system permease protein
LNGATKLAITLGIAVSAMISFHTFFVLFLVAAGLSLFVVARLRFRDFRMVIVMMLAFMVFNNTILFLFAPHQGNFIYGSTTTLFHLFLGYDVTSEQLFYQLNVSLKYFAIMPVALSFFVTTKPSEFAASLNRIGVNYKIAYSVALALRYIPDVQRSFREISQSRQARGVDLSRNQKLSKRLRGSVDILFPLILSGMDRIDVVASAMELRRFGVNKKRTWYSMRSFSPVDVALICTSGFCVLASILIVRFNGGRFYNPFL